MAVPKRKTSKKVKNQRRTHKKLNAPGFVKCENCGEFSKPHNVCKSCGQYNGKQIVNK